MVEIMFYTALVICTATVLVVAIKGFQELMAPIKAERAKKLKEQQGNGKKN